MPRSNPSALERLLPLVVGILAAYELVLGLWMVIAPRSFFDQIAAFGAYPPHFIRDTSTYQLALGATLAVAVSRPSWRAPLLAFAALQSGLHAINHWVDVGNASSLGIGLFDAISLTVFTVVIAVLWRAAAAEPVRERAP
jgi:hypothetical protein